MFILFEQKKKERNTTFLSKISIHACIIILYTLEKIFCCCYCLETFSTEEILKIFWFEINGKQKIRVFKKDEYVKSKSYERKIKSPF